jgi:signal transduction histidine kinase
VGSGSVSYAVSDVNGCDALRHAIELIEPLIAQQGLVFDGIAGDSSIVVRADPEKVTQILVNLLSNANEVHTGRRARQRRVCRGG